MRRGATHLCGYTIKRTKMTKLQKDAAINSLSIHDVPISIPKCKKKKNDFPNPLFWAAYLKLAKDKGIGPLMNRWNCRGIF